MSDIPSDELIPVYVDIHIPNEDEIPAELVSLIRSGRERRERDRAMCRKMELEMEKELGPYEWTFEPTAPTGPIVYEDIGAGDSGSVMEGPSSKTTRSRKSRPRRGEKPPVPRDEELHALLLKIIEAIDKMKRTFECGWKDCDGLNYMHIEGGCCVSSDVSTHLLKHVRSAPWKKQGRKVSVECGWEGCGEEVEGGRLYRHICNVHLPEEYYTICPEEGCEVKLFDQCDAKCHAAWHCHTKMEPGLC